MAPTVVDNACVMLELEPEMLVAAEEDEPKPRVDEDWKGNVVDADDGAEAAEVDNRLKLGKEAVDAFTAAEPASTDVMAEIGRAHV